MLAQCTPGVHIMQDLHCKWTVLWSRQQTQWQWWRGPGAGPRRMFQIGVIYFFLVMARYKHDILACIPSFTVIK